MILLSLGHDVCQESSNGVSYPHFRWSSLICWQNVCGYSPFQRRHINSWVGGSVSVYWLDYTQHTACLQWWRVCVRIVRYYTSILQNPILNKNMCGIALYCSEVVDELNKEDWCCSCCRCGLWPFESVTVQLKPQTLWDTSVWNHDLASNRSRRQYRRRP